MKTFKNIIYALTCLSFSIIIGAGVYEHLAIWPIVYSAPPVSLTMIQGDYGLSAGAFWTKIHPITLLLFIITLIIFWKSERRKNIVIVLIGYILIIATTGLYFVPELIDIISTEPSTIVDVELQHRGSIWIKLSLLRMGVLIMLSMVLFFGLTKNAWSESREV